MSKICNVGYILSASKLKRFGFVEMPCNTGGVDCLQETPDGGVAFSPFNSETAMVCIY